MRFLQMGKKVIQRQRRLRKNERSVTREEQERYKKEPVLDVINKEFRQRKRQSEEKEESTFKGKKVEA